MAFAVQPQPLCQLTLPRHEYLHYHKKGGEVTGFLEDIQHQEAHEKFPQEFQEIPTLFWLSKFLLVLESTQSFVRPHISGKAISEQHLLAPVPIFCKELLVVVLWLPHIYPISKAEGWLEISQYLSRSMLTLESYMISTEEI